VSAVDPGVVQVLREARQMAATAAVWACPTNDGPTTRLVLLLLAFKATEPSGLTVDRIARYTRTSNEYCRRIVHDLVDRGLVLRLKPTRVGGAPCYRLDVRRIARIGAGE
jgi:hypothetical protein